MARSYFQSLIQLFPLNSFEKERSLVYYYLEQIQMRLTHFNRALIYLNQSLEKKSSSNDQLIGSIFNSLANYSNPSQTILKYINIINEH